MMKKKKMGKLTFFVDEEVMAEELIHAPFKEQAERLDKAAIKILRDIHMKEHLKLEKELVQREKSFLTQPCQFCGGEDLIFATSRELAGNPSVWHTGPETWNAVCRNPKCGATISHNSQQKVIKAWNNEKKLA